MIFFFQAEDGIRDLTVTGVQTCALPIYARPSHTCTQVIQLTGSWRTTRGVSAGARQTTPRIRSTRVGRSEERRVGKECRNRWNPNNKKKSHLDDLVRRKILTGRLSWSKE